MMYDVSLEDCRKFPGGWSVCPKFMYNAFRHVERNGTLKILEIGGGAGSYSLWQLLVSKGIPAKVVTYENNASYLPSILSTDKQEHIPVFWETWPKEIQHGPFDLVLLDGPNGVVRERWYPLLRKVVSPGTVLAIDDYGHYQEFEDALNRNFEYAVVAEESPKNRRGVTWKIVQILSILGSHGSR